MVRMCHVTTVASVVLFLVMGTANSSLSMDYVEKGIQAMRRGRLDTAVAWWTQAIDRNPKSYSAYVNRGSAYMGSGYVRKAISDWHKAKALSPLFAYGVFSGDFVRQASGDTSMLNFAAALELDPDHVPSVCMMGLTYLDLGLPEMAAALYRQSIELTKNPLLKSHFDHWADTLEP